LLEEVRYELKGRLVHLLSEMLLVRGTEPVKRTTIIPKANKVMPKEREKYVSRAVGSRTSGERRAMMIVGETINGKACRANQPAVP
jgi:hypothetical protein